MVMEREQPPRQAPSNTMLLMLAGAILLLGAGFLFAYDTLRSSRVALVSPAAAGNDSASQFTGRGAAPSDQDSLRELGIDPERSDLSPEAQAAIARAHRAARDAEAAAAREAAAAEPVVEEAVPAELP